MLEEIRTEMPTQLADLREMERGGEITAAQGIYHADINTPNSGDA